MEICFVAFGFMFVALAFIGALARNPAGQFDRLSANGIPARGILLQVAQTSSGMSGRIGRRFQSRRVRIDIEVPGRAPYEVRGLAWIPMNCVRDVLPGATVELRVDASNPQKFVIIGPGVGFAPQIVPTGPPLGPSTQGYGA